MLDAAVSLHPLLNSEPERKSVKKRTTRAPSEVRTFNQVCELERDNISTRKSWMAVDADGSVSIYNQKPGNPSTGNVSLSRAEFLKLSEWYTKPQKIVKRQG